MDSDLRTHLSRARGLGSAKEGVHHFWAQRITALAASGTTIIITTHFMEEAEYCDRIVIQGAGKLLAMGTPREVREQAGGQGSTLNMEQAFIAIVESNRHRAKAGTA